MPLPSLIWKTKRSGQVAPNKDSIYEYEVTTTNADYFVKSFCTKVLLPSSHELPEGDFSGNCSFPFGLESYYKFTKLLKENTYRYIVCEPYTG